MYLKENELRPAYISKINSNCEKQIILLMIPKEVIKSKHHGDFYCLICLHSIRTEKVCKKYVNGKACKNKDFCGFVMSSEKHKILEFNQCMKSDQMPYIIYSDIESLIKK